MTKFVEDIKPARIDSAYVEAPFDKAKLELERNGYEVISLEDNARLRMQEGENRFISRYGNFTREAFIYVPKKGIYLTRNSPIMEKPVLATRYSKNKIGYFLSNKLVEKYLADSILISDTNIPTNKFKENCLTNFLFGDQANNYGFFLLINGVDEMPILCNDKLFDKPFISQIWFSELNCKSALICDDSLYYNCRVRGIKNLKD